MEVDCIIQARMSSSRLPGKVLMNIGDNSVLEFCIKRLQKVKNINRIIVATSNNNSDNKIVDWCKKNKILFYRGSINDLLERYYNTCLKFNIKNILRITSDCPLVDPILLEIAIKNYFKNNFEIYGLGGEFPDGLDFTIFKFSVLEDSYINATKASDREHVCPYMERHSNNIGVFRPFVNSQNIRLTIDEKSDLILLNNMYKIDKNLINLNSFQILNILNNNPELIKINNKIIRNEGYLKSIKND